MVHVQENLKYPRDPLSFSQNNVLKLLNLKAYKLTTKTNFPNLSHATLQYTLWMLDHKTV